MKIKLSLSQPGRNKAPEQTVQFELNGKSWSGSIQQLATAGNGKSHERGKQSITRHLADIDHVLVDDFRRTL